MSEGLTLHNRRIHTTLTDIETDIVNLRELTTQIPGQRILSKREDRTTRLKNIRNSVEESSKVAKLSNRLLSSIGDIKRGLSSDEDEDISPSIVLIRTYIVACNNMFRHFHKTNSMAFKGIILQCKAILDNLSEKLINLEELITERNSGNVPSIQGNTPLHSNSESAEKSGGRSRRSRRIHVKPRSRTRKNRCN